MVRGTERDSVVRLSRSPKREIVLLVLVLLPAEIVDVIESGDVALERSAEETLDAACLDAGIEK